MPRQCPPHFRRDMVNQMLAGKSVLFPVPETPVPERALHRWKHQALVNQGRVDGVNSEESAQLRVKELQLVKDASELFDAQAMVPPKGGRPQPKVSERAAIQFVLPPGCLR